MRNFQEEANEIFSEKAHLKDYNIKFEEFFIQVTNFGEDALLSAEEDFPNVQKLVELSYKAAKEELRRRGYREELDKQQKKMETKFNQKMKNVKSKRLQTKKKMKKIQKNQPDSLDESQDSQDTSL